MPLVRVNDIEVYHEISGEGEPVLLLHGLGSSTRDWEYQEPDFSKHYRVIACDTRGHGRSSKPPGPYSVPMFAADTAGLLRQLGTGPVHVVSISMGGMIGIQLALDEPELVRSLLVCNAGPELDFKGLRNRLTLFLRMSIVRFLGMRMVGRKLAGEMFPEPGQEEFREKLITRWAENDKHRYLDTLRALVSWSVADRIAELACPLLVVRGELDGTPMDFSEEQLRGLGRARRVVIGNSRHATPVDQSERFNRIALDFLASLG